MLEEKSTISLSEDTTQDKNTCQIICKKNSATRIVGYNP